VILFPGGKLRLLDQRRGFSGRGTRDGGGGIQVGWEIFAKLGILYVFVLALGKLTSCGSPEDEDEQGEAKPTK
jgi:hypothetical protein